MTDFTLLESSKLISRKIRKFSHCTKIPDVAANFVDCTLVGEVPEVGGDAHGQGAAHGYELAHGQGVAHGVAVLPHVVVELVAVVEVGCGVGLWLISF